MSISLKSSMIPIADEIVRVGKVKPMDVALEKFEELKNEIPNCGVVDDMNAPLLAAQCNGLVDLCNTYAQVCNSFYMAARKMRKMEQAYALLERSPLYFEEKAIKPTDITKKAYVDMDPRAMDAQSIENAWNVLYNFFVALHDDFRDRHIWYRRIIEMKLNEQRSCKVQ